MFWFIVIILLVRTIIFNKDNFTYSIYTYILYHYKHIFVIHLSQVFELYNQLSIKLMHK